MTERVFIVTGSRAWPSKAAVFAVLARHAPSLVVHGACPGGVDVMAELWCKLHAVDYHGMPARWDTDKGFNRRAGPERNRRMLIAYPGVTVLAFPHGPSPGTRGCMAEAKRLGHPLEVFDIDGEETT